MYISLLNYHIASIIMYIYVLIKDEVDIYILIASFHLYISLERT